MKNKNIITVRNLIKCLDIKSLRNPEVVANLARTFGIVQWGLPVFGDEEIFKNASEDMAGIYQTPTQIAPALVYLSHFKIDSYLEIGVFQGGNFIFTSEYLKRFNPGIVCTGIDPTNFLNPEIKEIIESESYLNFAQLTSYDVVGKEFDLVFIDGDHSTEWINADFENVGKYADICMFHDIQETSCPDAVEYWKNSKKDSSIEFIHCTTKSPLQGIGIL